MSKDQGCAPTSDLSCVTDGPTRTVWDGSDEVAEIKAPLGASNGAELNAGFPLIPWSPAGDPNPFYGRVVYAPGLTVGQPQSATRYDYRDNPSGGVSATWPTFTLMPFWDYRGTPVYGVTTDGATAIPLNPGGTSCPNPGVATTTRCVLLSWNFAADAYRQESGNLLTLSWHGTVLQNKKDGSGLQYMRNRVYDPATARFTQEDPIGLAGGLNSYGFAGGDPINRRDPFGLKTCDPPDFKCYLGTRARELLDAMGGKNVPLVSAQQPADSYVGVTLIAPLVQYQYAWGAKSGGRMSFSSNLLQAGITADYGQVGRISGAITALTKNGGSLGLSAGALGVSVSQDSWQASVGPQWGLKTGNVKIDNVINAFSRVNVGVEPSK